jgi:membrane-bound lytic murein transglycosylase B
VAEVAEETGIPEAALRGYADAALRMAAERPWCGLGWNTLAAIGHVESAHGGLGGATLGADGRALPRIVGAPLDGTVYSAVMDTDGGELDGDAVWDRAVGPMQFLPSTWRLYARDGNGDGVRDIDQIDDAALTAAELLCVVGGDLRDPQRWIAAIDGYNPSVDYNNAVAEAADYYAQFG